MPGWAAPKFRASLGAAVAAARGEERHLAADAAARAAVPDHIDRAVVGAIPDEVQGADHVLVYGLAVRVEPLESLGQVRIGKPCPVSLAGGGGVGGIGPAGQGPRSGRRLLHKALDFAQ